jgi:hypothetical protein
MSMRDIYQHYVDGGIPAVLGDGTGECCSGLGISTQIRAE